MRSVLVTGGSGFIGSHTCLTLLEKGYLVTVFDNFIYSQSSLLYLPRRIQISEPNTTDLLIFPKRFHQF